MKTLKFRSNLIKPILEGVKTSTWRLFDDKNLSKEDKISLIDWKTKIEFKKAIITEVIERSFDELTPEDLKGHEKYNSKEDMYKGYEEYYNKPVNENTKVKIIRFKLL